jgi:hypothetical protein
MKKMGKGGGGRMGFPGMPPGMMPPRMGGR